MTSKSPMIIQRIYDFFFHYFRTKRMKNFVDMFHPTGETYILDVGGTAYNWTIIDIKSKVTLLNLSIPTNHTSLQGNFNFVEGDGTNLKYGDEEFDICFSNSVIEHLGTYEKQVLFSREACRVGKKIWVQTPARSFFFEPHWLGPFIHYFPVRMQRRLARYFTLRGWLMRPDQEYIDKFLAELRLLSYKEMKQLFPDCEIRVERFLGMVKAFIAVRQ